jgi:hypothetical protein
MEKPTNLPDNGFYYHYKHDPEGEINNYSYEVIGVALNTESRDYAVLYRPLYENIFLAPANYCARPLGMFMENVEKDGKIIPRFTKIDDEGVIKKLEVLRKGMYLN